VGSVANLTFPTIAARSTCRRCERATARDAYRINALESGSCKQTTSSLPRCCSVVVAFLIVFIVQAAIYIPRALAADREERQP